MLHPSLRSFPDETHDQWCSFCECMHPYTEEFWAISKFGHPTWCRQRRRYNQHKYNSKYKKGGPKQDWRASWIPRKYGITVEDVDNMRKAQDGACKICGTTEFTGSGKCLVIDHDHETGKVRGLLCHRCNLALGYVDDKIETLAQMIKYLEDAREDNA